MRAQPEKDLFRLRNIYTREHYTRSILVHPLRRETFVDAARHAWLTVPCTYGIDAGVSERVSHIV